MPRNSKTPINNSKFRSKRHVFATEPRKSRKNKHKHNTTSMSVNSKRVKRSLFSVNHPIAYNKTEYNNDYHLFKNSTNGVLKDLMRSSPHDIVPVLQSHHDIIPAQSSQHDIVPARSSQHDIVPARSSQHDIVPARSSQHDIVPARSSQHSVCNLMTPPSLLPSRFRSKNKRSKAPQTLNFQPKRQRITAKRSLTSPRVPKISSVPRRNTIFGSRKSLMNEFEAASVEFGQSNSENHKNISNIDSETGRIGNGSPKTCEAGVTGSELANVSPQEIRSGESSANLPNKSVHGIVEKSVETSSSSVVILESSTRKNNSGEKSSPLNLSGIVPEYGVNLVNNAKSNATYKAGDNGSIAMTEEYINAAKSPSVKHSANSNLDESFNPSLFNDSFDASGEIIRAENFVLPSQLPPPVPALQDRTGRLQNRTGRLQDVTDRLQDGTCRLQDGTGRLQDGTGRLQDGTGRLQGGTCRLQD
eukprot:969900_1